MRNTERSLALVAVLALALLPLATQAQDSAKTTPNRWRRLAISEDDTTYIDTRSIVRGPIPDEVSVWIETRFNAPQTHSILGKNYTRQLARATFDCKARTTWLVSWTTYLKNGSVAGEDDHPAYPLDTPVALRPGTAGETVLEAVCSPSNEHMAAGTSNSVANYPPSPTELFIPPLPMPDRVRGFHLVADYDIDETGKVMDFKFTPTPDGGYNKRLEEVLKSLKFRPGTAPDGTPVRMKGQIVYDF
jgi:hypothetical protein